jgi:hypothetical protein
MKKAVGAVDDGEDMWQWRALGLAAALTGCTRPNPLFAPVLGDGAPSDRGAVEAPGTEVPPDQRGEPADAADAALAEVPLDSPSESPHLAEAGLTPDSAPPADVISPPSSLVAHWTLNEASGMKAADSSPNRYDGDLEGGLTSASWVQTPRGGGLRFPRGLTAGIRVGQPDAVPPKIQALTRFTLAAWTFRATGNTGLHQSIVSRQLDGNTEIFNLTFDNQFLKLYVYPERPDDTLLASGVLTSGAAGGVWVHVAATYDGAYLRVYVDGALGNAPLAYSGALTSSQFPLYLGTNKNDPAENQPFDGILDEVMIFSRALDANAIGRARDGDLSGL